MKIPKFLEFQDNKTSFTDFDSLCYIRYVKSDKIVDVDGHISATELCTLADAMDALDKGELEDGKD